jgi:hypothetical protein
LPYKEPCVYRWYFVLQTEDQRKESGFKKNVYALINQKAPFLIHYVGSESLVVPFAHKLCKDKTKHLTRTAPSTLNELKEAVHKEDAHVIYKNSQSKYRNLKQCQNFKQYINKQKHLLWDEIYNTVLIYLELSCVKGKFM